MKQIILVILALVFLETNAQPKWQELNLTPNQQATSFDFAPGNVVFASFKLVGSQDQILQKTVDNGQNWTVIPHAIDSAQFMAFDAMDDSTIYVCYRKLGLPNVNVSKVFRTTDGGNSWFDLTPDTTETGYGWTSIEFTSDSVGYWAIAEKVYKTTNAGHSWTTISLPTGHNAISMDFLNDTTGVIGTWDGTFGYHGGLLLTTDGGQTWADTAFLSENYTIMPSVRMDEGGVAYGSTAGYNPYYNHLLFRSDDFGASWNQLPIPRSLPGYDLVSFDIHEGAGFLVEESEGNSYLFSTEDEGISWTSLQTIDGIGLWYMKLDNTRGFLGGPANRIFYLDRTTSVSKPVSHTRLHISPNPASNRINIYSETIRNGMVRLYNLEGKLIREQKYASEMTMHVQGLPAGLYVVELISETRSEKSLFLKN